MNSTRFLSVVTLLVLASGVGSALRADASVQTRRNYTSSTGGLQIFGSPSAVGNSLIPGTTPATPAVPPPPPTEGERRSYNSTTGGIPLTIGAISIGTTTGALPAGPSGRREFNGVR